PPNDAGRAEIGAKTPSRELESAQKITKTRRAMSKQGFFQQPANRASDALTSNTPTDRHTGRFRKMNFSPPSACRGLVMAKGSDSKLLLSGRHSPAPCDT
ncbi:MAG: hypothetical protein ACOZE5_12325, partial [Verrucomicrobiota bacterium]